MAILTHVDLILGPHPQQDGDAFRTSGLKHGAGGTYQVRLVQDWNLVLVRVLLVPHLHELFSDEIFEEDQLVQSACPMNDGISVAIAVPKKYM